MLYDLSLINLALLALAMFFAGFVDAIAGGGGLIQTPAMLLALPDRDPVSVVATGKEDAVFDAAEKLAADLESRGISVMLDDRRGTSPGVKFKDAELIGIPVIVVVGKALEAGNVEVRVRKTGDKSEVSVASAADEIAKTLATLP